MATSTIATSAEDVMPARRTLDQAAAKLGG
jgi:hypothetical protein